MRARNVPEGVRVRLGYTSQAEVILTPELALRVC
jgi:hypothetical protein